MQIFALLQVLLARHKESTKYYAVKVLQKKIIMKKKEVSLRFMTTHTPKFIPLLFHNVKFESDEYSFILTSTFLPAKTHHG